MARGLSNILLTSVTCVALVACGTRATESEGDAGIFADAGRRQDAALPEGHPELLETNNTIWSIFNRQSTENTVLVNRYIWSASLEVLDFLPVQSIDPFTGVIVTGFGTPPGGGRAYRATVLIDDPALDARSLKVALQSRGGPVNPSTTRAIEDAILTRARQLRVADSRI